VVQSTVKTTNLSSLEKTTIDKKKSVYCCHSYCILYKAICSKSPIVKKRVYSRHYLNYPGLIGRLSVDIDRRKDYSRNIIKTLYQRQLYSTKSIFFNTVVLCIFKICLYFKSYGISTLHMLVRRGGEEPDICLFLEDSCTFEGTGSREVGLRCDRRLNG
jgi:hypothetical protein